MFDWLHRYDPMGKGGLSFDDFIATVDLLVMGRKSFEKVLTFNPWPYRDMPVVVLSSRTVSIAERLKGTVRSDSAEPQDLVRKYAAEGKKHMYVDGGITIQRFLKARLLNEITITWIPVLLGKGIPLFGNLGAEVQLRHLETTAFKNGFVQTRYAVDGV